MSVAASATEPERRAAWRVEIDATLQVTSDEARKKAAAFLFLHVGNMLYAGRPLLLVVGQVVRWRVPVLYGLHSKGALGTVGDLIIDVESGDIVIEESTAPDAMEERAEELYREAERTPASAGARV